MSIEFYNRNWRMPNSWNGTEDNNTKFSNYSMSFDGSSEYIDLGSDTSLNIGGDLSISAWVYVDAHKNFNFIISKFTDGSNRNYELYVRNEANVSFVSNSDSTNSTTTIPINTWTHLIVTVQSGVTNGTKFYFNGVLDSTTGTTTVISQSNSTTIARRSTGLYNFNGKIDHLSIFDFELSQAQVTQLYGSSSTGVGNPMAITNGRKPIFYYPIGDYSAFNGEYLVSNSAVSDYVFDFDGTDNISFAAANTGPLNDIGTGDFTVSIWANAVSNSNYRTLIGNYGTGLLMWKKISSNVFECYVGSDLFTTTYVIPFDNTWHHYLITRSGTDVTLYVDGVSVKTGSSSSSLASSSISYIGDQPNSSRRWKGELSNVAIFNTALPATGTESIQSLYNYGTPPDISSYSGLQGWWKLDASATFDGSNWSIPDSSSNSNTGTSNGMTAANLVQSNLNILSPYSRYALDFDGSNDYIDCGNDTSLQITNNLTVSTWIKTDSSSFQGIIYKGLYVGTTGAGSSYAMYFNTAGKITLQFYLTNTEGLSSGTIFNVTTSNSYNDGKWHNITAVKNLTSVSLYVDNALDGTATATLNYIVNSTQNVTIGSKSDGSFNFNGSLSSFSIWNAALTSAQVTEIYNEGKPSNLNNHSAYSNLVSWWQLGENMSYDSNVWTVIDEKGTNNGTGANLAPAEDSIVDGVGTTANGLSSGMGGADNILGEAPYSNSNALSYGMGADAKSTSVPS